jgi:hypothetical protein
MSPSKIVLGRSLNFHPHCRIEYGQYVQTHEEHDNSIQSRTIGALALRPTGNIQGGYYFMSLSSGLRINRRNWTPLPMPEEVISQVHRMARRSRIKRHLVFQNRRNDDLDVMYPPTDDDNDGPAPIVAGAAGVDDNQSDENDSDYKNENKSETESDNENNTIVDDTSDGDSDSDYDDANPSSSDSDDDDSASNTPGVDPNTDIPGVDINTDIPGVDAEASVIPGMANDNQPNDNHDDEHEIVFEADDDVDDDAANVDDILQSGHDISNNNLPIAGADGNHRSNRIKNNPRMNYRHLHNVGRDEAYTMLIFDKDHDLVETLGDPDDEEYIFLTEQINCKIR